MRSAKVILNLSRSNNTNVQLILSNFLAHSSTIRSHSSCCSYKQWLCNLLRIFLSFALLFIVVVVTSWRRFKYRNRTKTTVERRRAAQTRTTTKPIVEREKYVNKYQVHAQTHTYQSIAKSIHVIFFFFKVFIRKEKCYKKVRRRQFDLYSHTQ